jgi:hypothetical protein
MRAAAAYSVHDAPAHVREAARHASHYPPCTQEAPLGFAESRDELTIESDYEALRHFDEHASA